MNILLSAIGCILYADKIVHSSWYPQEEYLNTSPLMKLMCCWETKFKSAHVLKQIFQVKKVKPIILPFFKIESKHVISDYDFQESIIL